MEHRWGRRIALQTPVRLIAGSGDAVPGVTANVSISGAFVRTAHRLAPSTRLEVEVVLPGRLPASRVRLAAHVIRGTSTGAAIEWAELAPRPVCELLRALDPAPAASGVGAVARAGEAIASASAIPAYRNSPPHLTL